MGSWQIPNQGFGPVMQPQYPAVMAPSSGGATPWPQQGNHYPMSSLQAAAAYPLKPVPILAGLGAVMPHASNTCSQFQPQQLPVPYHCMGPGVPFPTVPLPTMQPTLSDSASTTPGLTPASSFSSVSSKAPSTKASIMSPMPSGKEQESERMERLPEGAAPSDPLTAGIQLVSLGCYCGPKLSFKKMGRGSETLPFDWMRTRLDGLLDFMRNDFEGFYDFCSTDPVPGSHMVVYRNYNHSFWHDDPRDPQMKEKYARRIQRFQTINASSRPVLFVRVMATTDEIPRLMELASELQSRFGPQARLLCVANMQHTMVGPALVDSCPGLMLHYLHSNAYAAGLDAGEATYGKAVQAALDWIVGRPVNVQRFPNLAVAHAAATPANVGDEAYGLRAFEGPAVPTYKKK
eukprot:CAMPEP_0178438670 /NCGR_PEP_ID=MMETSP0689_2-20121128/35720_1 /TAXON_ID=160604 /ORGANISM="Amphidinium massartii, Strain CS-259" /LENGTH=403 /DNA_ID=CAMNT_0020061095 /DNA_START=54 /DNA_END=1265 /DNA_ORIENTATION=-